MNSHAISIAVASMVCFAGHAEDIAPYPFPATGCYVPEVTTCCKALDIDGDFGIRCDGVAETCYPSVVSAANVGFWQEAVGPGYTTGTFYVMPSDAHCTYRLPACDTTGPTPKCGLLAGQVTRTCDDQILRQAPPGGTDCSSGGGPVN